MKIKSQEGILWDYDSVVNMMDDELREEIHARIPTKNAQEFYDVYCAAHKSRHGEEFEFDKKNPQV